MVFATLLACLVAQLASPETTVTPPWDETRDVQVGLDPARLYRFQSRFPPSIKSRRIRGLTTDPPFDVCRADHYLGTKPEHRWCNSLCPQDASNPNWDGVRAYDNANHLNWNIAPVVIPSELGAEVANPFRLTGVGQFENAPMDSPSLGADQVGSVMVENWSEGTLAVAEQADLLDRAVHSYLEVASEMSFRTMAKSSAQEVWSGSRLSV